MVYREAYDEIGFPSKRCCQARLGMTVSGMMLPTELIKTKQVLFSRHVPKRRCGFEEGQKKNGEGWGRKNWTFDVKGGFCRSERGTKLKMRRGKGRERGVSINTFFFLLTLTIFFLILRWSRAVLSDFISVYFTTSMILMLFVFVLLFFVFVFFSLLFFSHSDTE